MSTSLGNSLGECHHTQGLYANDTLMVCVAVQVIFSMIGALIRSECDIFSNHDMYDAYPAMYANILGCAIMGPLVIYKAWLISNVYAVYIGLGVGLCGSITTFSSWQAEAMFALTHWNTSPYQQYKQPWDQVVGSVTIQVVGLATSISALTFGMLVTKIFAENTYDFDASKPRRVPAQAQDYKIFACAVVVCTLCIVLNATHEREDVAWACALAPFGTFARYFYDAFMIVFVADMRRL